MNLDPWNDDIESQRLLCLISEVKGLLFNGRREAVGVRYLARIRIERITRLRRMKDFQVEFRRVVRLESPADRQVRILSARSLAVRHCGPKNGDKAAKLSDGFLVGHTSILSIQEPIEKSSLTEWPMPEVMTAICESP